MALTMIISTPTPSSMTLSSLAGNILSQVDGKGYNVSLLDSIVNYRKDSSEAVPLTDRYLYGKGGRRRFRITIAGWNLLVRWKDGSERWIDLKDMKESQLETAEFAKARGIDREPAFAWWVPYTHEKRDTILAAVKKEYDA
jgi:hypothetical protein